MEIFVKKNTGLGTKLPNLYRDSVEKYRTVH